MPTLDDVRRAAERIAPHAHRTPVLTCEALDRAAGARVFLKCENLQKVGAFKFRGACNAVFSLSAEQAARGVVAHSSGNHAQALALAARLRGVPAYLVMPRTATAVKKIAVEAYGGRITYCDPTLAAREAAQAQVVASTGAHAVHPFDDARVIAGQGTAALEFLGEAPGLDILMAPVGGGGLVSGSAIVAAALAPGLRVIAAEPALADDAQRSLASGRIEPACPVRTIADGLLTSLGERTFRIIRRHVERVVTVSEAGIVQAMRFVWERAKIVIEPSAAVPVAALFEHREVFAGQRVGIVLTGGNVDLDRLPWAAATNQ